MPAILAALLLTACAQGAYRQGAVTTADGASLAYYVRDGRDPPLVLIPGSWGDHRVFDRFVGALGPDQAVVIVELRGHGASRPAARAPSMHSLADDVLAVVDALRLKRFAVGGHSIGGMIAIEIAGRRQAAVAAVISMEGWTHHEVAREAFGVEPRVPYTARAQQTRQSLSAEELAAFASVWRQWDGSAILQATSVPVLEIWGDRGKPRPDRSQLRIPKRANIELVWVAGASHRLLIDAPDTVGRLTADFLARLGKTSGK